MLSIPIIITFAVYFIVVLVRPNDTILGIVAYAWGGFGAAFGPLVLFSLYSKKTTWYSALSGMVVGTVTLVLWKQIGYGDWLYEIVPGFTANALTILTINTLYPSRDKVTKSIITS